MPYNLTTLENGCRELDIELSQKQKNQFIQFYEFLVEKNKVMNLTGITEFEEVLERWRRTGSRAFSATVST